MPHTIRAHGRCRCTSYGVNDPHVGSRESPHDRPGVVHAIACMMRDRRRMVTRKWAACAAGCRRRADARACRVRGRLPSTSQHASCLFARVLSASFPPGYRAAITSRHCGAVLDVVKVLRFAPTPRARGLRTLTTPARRSRPGFYVMARTCAVTLCLPTRLRPQRSPSY